MLLLFVVSLIFYSACSLNLTIVDQGQNISVALQKYFNHSLEYPSFMVDTTKSIPSNISQYFNFSFENKFFETNSAQMTFKKQNKTFHLNEHIIYQTLSIQTQPLKLFLTEDTLMMVLFDDQLKDKSTIISILNLSESTNRSLFCQEQTFDSKGFKLFVQCQQTKTNSHLTLLINLERANSIVNSMLYIRSFNSSGQLKECEHRKIMYANEIFINPTHYSINQIFLYCPPAYNPSKKLLAVSFNASLQNITRIYSFNFDNCTKNCCDSAENIFYFEKDQTYIQTKNTLYEKSNKSNQCTVIITYDNFISLRIGSITQSRDIYVLSQKYLYIKYPTALTNFQLIDITEPDMSPVAFTVTKDYIITQLLNETKHRAILKVHKIVNSNPKLLDIVEIDYSATLFGTENYLEEADYMYLFDLSDNTLSVAYYQGLRLNIGPIIKIGMKNFEIVVINFDNNVSNTNETLKIFISVYNFDDTQYFVDYSQLRYVFEQSFVRLPLRDGVIGPLVQFYTIDPISLDKEFLNGMYLIDMEKALFYQDSVKNIVGLLLERNNNLTEPLTMKFALKVPDQYQDLTNKGEGNFIFLYDCSLIYNISVFEIDKCNNLTKVINQSVIDLNKMKGFFYVKNTMHNAVDSNYLIYDEDSMLLCNNTFCQKKQLPEQPLQSVSIKVINTNYGVFLMQLNTNSKSLRLLELGNMNDNKLILKMEINQTKLVDLYHPDVIITDYYTDEQFDKILIVQLNNSKVYVMQKQTIQDQETIFSHATSLIQLSNITICTQFNRMFYISESIPNKIVILCNSNRTTTYHLVEFKINNLFDVQKTRQYPLYGYVVHSNSSLHFSDNQFIYIATVDPQSCYLVYNTLSITPNVLMEKIPATDHYNLVGSIKNQVKSKGYGLIDKNAFVISSSYYEGIVNTSDGRESIIQDVASFAVRNNQDQLSLVEFQIIINLTKSQIGYSLTTDTFLLQNRISVVNMSLETSKLSGPVTTADISSSCDYWPEIEKSNIFTADQPLKQADDEENNLLDGTFSSYASLSKAQLIVTSDKILCIQNKTIKKWIEQNYTDCRLTNFSSEAKEQALISCMYYKVMIFRILRVSDECQMTFENISIFNRTLVSSFKTYYPYLLVELPILDKQNKNYQSCIYNETTKKFEQCEYLTNDLRKYFLSVDYDIYKEYGLILEKGIGIYNISSADKDLMWYISDDDLTNMGIDAPYKYAKILSASSNPLQIVVEIANEINSFQLSYDFKSAKIIRTYQQYVDCTNIYHKSIDTGQYKIKICDFLQPSVDILDQIIELERKPKRIIQFYLKQGKQNYPVSMFDSMNSSYIYLSNNQIISITPDLNIWYYNITNEISWVLSFNVVDNQDERVCSHNLIIKNDHFVKQYPLKFKVNKPPPNSTISLYLAHIPFVCLLLAFPLVKKFGSNTRKLKSVHSISKKISYKKNFYSNDFEDRLKVLNQSLIESKIAESKIVESHLLQC